MAGVLRVQQGALLQGERQRADTGMREATVSKSPCAKVWPCAGRSSDRRQPRPASTDDRLKPTAGSEKQMIMAATGIAMARRSARDQADDRPGPPDEKEATGKALRQHSEQRVKPRTREFPAGRDYGAETRGSCGAGLQTRRHADDSQQTPQQQSLFTPDVILQHAFVDILDILSESSR